MIYIYPLSIRYWLGSKNWFLAFKINFFKLILKGQNQYGKIKFWINKIKSRINRKIKKINSLDWKNPICSFDETPFFLQFLHRFSVYKSLFQRMVHFSKAPKDGAFFQSTLQVFSKTLPSPGCTLFQRTLFQDLVTLLGKACPCQQQV